MIWSSMTYKSYGVHQWVMCIKISDGARLEARSGGDRVGIIVPGERPVNTGGTKRA
jgi:hypothetical protein